MNNIDAMEKTTTCMETMLEIVQQCNQGLEGMITDSDLIETFIDCKKTIHDNRPDNDGAAAGVFLMALDIVNRRIGDIACRYIESNSVKDEDLRGLSTMAYLCGNQGLHYVTKLTSDMLDITAWDAEKLLTREDRIKPPKSAKCGPSTWLDDGSFEMKLEMDKETSDKLKKLLYEEETGESAQQ